MKDSARKPASQPTVPSKPAVTSTDESMLDAVAASPVLWGVGLATAFYLAIPSLPYQRDLIQRYFCGHPLEYLTTGLFFIGVALLLRKRLGLIRERYVFGIEPLKTILSPQLSEATAADAADKLERYLTSCPSSERQTYLVRRLGDVVAYFKHRGSSAGLDEHLKYLADLAGERLYESFALVRTITWAVPILGFLGTVMGITIAIANVTPEQLESSLHEVTGGLAVAFDTTALALALSLFLVFGSFLVERAEQSVLTRVEDIGLKRIPRLFPYDASGGNSFAEAEMTAAEDLLARTEELINWQTGLWRESIEAMRARWTETMTTEQHALREGWHQGIAASLGSHEEQLAAARNEFLSAFQRASTQFAEQIDKWQHLQNSLQESLADQLANLWGKIQSNAAEVNASQQVWLTQLAKVVGAELEQWHRTLSNHSQQADNQLIELREQRELMLQVLSEEQQLARLQARLTDNLEAVRAAETFEETLHSLSAAVHLLTSRVKPKAA